MHRAERETTTTGALAGRGALTAVAALAVLGGPAAGMALAGEAPAAGSDASQGQEHAGGDHAGHHQGGSKGEKESGGLPILGDLLGGGGSPLSGLGG